MSFFEDQFRPMPKIAARRGPERLASPLRVLVVEDELLIALLLEEYLVSIGCQVVGIARDSASACRLVDQEHPDLALLDINLANGTSVPVARHMAEQGRPFIFVTAYNDLEQLPKDLRQSTVLQKPVDPARLRTLVNQTTANLRN